MSLPLAALSRVDVASYVSTLIWVYTILVFIRILLTWLPRIPYNRYSDMAIRFVMDTVDPFLNVFRRFIPPIRLGGAALDISPIVALVFLNIVGNLVVNAIHG